MVDPANPTQPDTLWDSVTTGGRVPTDGFIGETLETIYTQGGTALYVDDPPSLGAGNRAQSYGFGQNLCIGEGDQFQFMKLRTISVRVDFPFAAGESILLRMWRFRRTPAFNFIQVTNSYTADLTTQPFSTTVDINQVIRPNFIFNKLTDSLAVGWVYTPGGTPTVRAFRVQFDFEVGDPDIDDTTIGSTTPTWPPT